MKKDSDYLIDIIEVYLEIVRLDREEYVISKEIEESRKKLIIDKKRVDIIDNMEDLEKVKLLKRRKGIN